MVAIRENCILGDASSNSPRSASRQPSSAYPTAMRLSLLFPLLAVALASLNTASAADVYVDNVLGNDRHSGLIASPLGGDGPVATFARALRIAGPSDRLVIANTGEPYREMLSLSGPHHMGSSNRPFVVVGNGAVLDGSVAAATGAWEHAEGDVFAVRPRRLAYQQLFSAGRPLQHNLAASQTGDAALLEPLQWALSGGKLFLRTEPGAIPENYDLRHCGLQTGITLYQTQHVRIENLIVQGFQQDGINAHEGVRDCELANVECRANGRAGLSVGGVSRVRVTNGNFYDNGRVQVRTEGMAELRLEACDVDDGRAPAYHHRGRELLVDGKRPESL